MINQFLAVFIGGGIGSALRYAVQLWLHERIVPYSFPWSTFAVNIAGCFAIGLFYGLSARFNWNSDLRLLLTAGLCGGFTTFSTFANDILAMLKTGNLWLPAIYLLLSICLGLLACLIGGILAK